MAMVGCLDQIKMELLGREDDLKHAASRQIMKPRLNPYRETLSPPEIGLSKHR